MCFILAVLVSIVCFFSFCSFSRFDDPVGCLFCLFLKDEQEDTGEGMDILTFSL